MSKLLITGCTDPLMWYSGRAGESFELIRDKDDSFLVHAADGYSNIVLKKDCEIVRPVKYTTEDLYGIPTLRVLKGEIHFIEIRLELLGNNLKLENAKHWSIRDSHLITKIIDAQKFWRERIKEIKC